MPPMRLKLSIGRPVESNWEGAPWTPPGAGAPRSAPFGGGGADLCKADGLGRWRSEMSADKPRNTENRSVALVHLPEGIANGPHAKSVIAAVDALRAQISRVRRVPIETISVEVSLTAPEHGNASGPPGKQSRP
jgi:hypothetical protein